MTAPALTDVRDVPLDELAGLGEVELGELLGHVLPGELTQPVPVASFNSSI